TTLRVEAPLDGWLKVGCSPACQVRIDGREVASVDKPYLAALDDTERSLKLAPGEHRLEVVIGRVGPKRTAPTLLLRIHDRHHQAPAGVSIASALDPAAVLAERLPVRWRKSAKPDGIEVQAAVGPV